MDNMPALIQYLLKLSISLGVVYLFYQLVLRRITFYTWNRWYLLGYTLLSFLIPFIDISPVLQQQEWAESNLVQWVPSLSASPEVATNVTEVATVSGGWEPWEIVMLVLATGMVIMAIRLLVQLWSFRRMLKKARLVTSEEMKLYEVNASIIPFSFGKSIFVNPALHTPKELEEIIRHEFVHVKQRHSLDIIWGELLCLLNWYNPFAWLIKSSVRQNLEFIADNKVLQHGIDRKQYQYLLLKVIGNHQFSIANQFNFSSLKKRIAMMNKIKSAKVHLLRFLFVLPLLAVLLVSFREKIGRLLNDNKPAAAATINEDKSPAPLLQTMYVAGKIVDRETYAPMVNIPLKVRVNNKIIATLKTDAAGYYFLADDISKRGGPNVPYEILIDHPSYYRVNGGVAAKDGATDNGLYNTIFLASKSKKSRSIAIDLTIAAADVLQSTDESAFIKAAIDRISQEKIEKNKEERKISTEFLAQNPNPAEWFTAYKGYLFSKEGKLMGTVADTRFFLMDDPSTYEAVNEYFRNAKELPGYTGAWREGIGWIELNFITEDFNKPAPPAALMTEANIQKMKTNEFIYMEIRGLIVYQNGRRMSTHGLNGWMVGKPGERKTNMYRMFQNKIKQILVFKNELARYYHPTASEVYWIELNNGVQVINRPRFSGSYNYAYADTIPKKPNSKGYYVEIIGVGSHCTVVISDKNHKEVKRILLNDWDAKEDYYVGLYGEILPPPPPGAPAPPNAPGALNLEAPGAPGAPPAPPIDTEYEKARTTFLKRNKDVKDLSWVYTSNGNGTESILKITKKDGTIESYRIDKEMEKAKAEMKYGELPIPEGLPVPPMPPAPMNKELPGAPPRPPAPVKAESTPIDISGHGHITISPTTAAVRKNTFQPKLTGNYEMIADTLVWVPLTRTLEFRGVSKQMNSGRIAGKFTVDKLSDEPYVLIDGKEFDLTLQSYAEYGKMFKVTFIQKSEAVRKYGVKGKNGAIEIVPFGC